MERSGFLPARVVQLHATLRCNLACEHCYSSSGPRQHTSIDVGEIVESLAVLRQEQYEIVSLSGGEPFLYPGLEALVDGAPSLGYRVTAVSNGMLLGREPAATVMTKLSLAAISIDGAPETHNALRGRRDAFRRTAEGIDRLRCHGVPFGIVFCVSSVSLADVVWVYEFALGKNARLLQLRPLALEGRARERMPELSLSGADRARLALIAEFLASDDPTKPRIQLDLAPRAALSAARPALALLDGATSPIDRALSDLVNPIVIEPDGTIVPFAYGFNDLYTIARVGTDCAAGISRFKRERAGDLAMLVDTLLGEYARAKHDYVDWYAEITARSHSLQAS